MDIYILVVALFLADGTLAIKTQPFDTFDDCSMAAQFAVEEDNAQSALDVDIKCLKVKVGHNA